LRHNHFPEGSGAVPRSAGAYFFWSEQGAKRAVVMGRRRRWQLERFAQL